MLAEEWAEGKILTQFNCVLLLPLREQLVSSASSLPDLIALLHPHKGTRDSVVNQLEMTSGKRVLIIADGWDELSEENRSKESFLYKLLFGHLLPSASTLLTSRPSASAHLHKLHTVDRLVEVVGFSEENVKQYIESEFQQCPEKAASLIEQVESNPVIQSVCSVPLNCAIVCHLWHTLEQAFPSTLTELYIKVVLNIILRNVEKKFPELSVRLSLNNFDNIPSNLQEAFWLTCEFAYKCLLQDQLVFTEDELPSHIPQVFDSSEKFLSFGLLQSALSLLPTGHGLSFHFLHLTFQEFLAALHIATLSNEEKLKICEAHAKSDRFSTVWRFVFGLISKEQTSCSAKVISGSDDLWNEIALCLLVSVRPLPHYIQSNMVLLFHYAFEASDPVLRTRGLEYYQINEFLDFKNAYDRMAGFYAFRYITECSEPLSVSFIGCLSDTLLKDLGDILSTSKLQVEALRLIKNKLSDKGVTDFFRKVLSLFSGLLWLDLSCNNLTDIMLSFVRTSPFINLTRLELSHNPLGVTGIQSLEAAIEAGVLIKLGMLGLDNTLTDDADINGALLTTLLASIASKCVQILGMLSLSDNILSIPGMCALEESIALRSLMSLHLNNTQTDDKSLSKLTNCVPLIELSLNNNPLEYCSIFKLHGYPMELYLENIITDTSSLDSHKDTYEVMQSTITMNNDLIILVLDNNSFSGERVQILVKILQVFKSLQCLNCSNCSLTSADIITLVHHLKLANVCCNSLKLWYINDNFIDDKGTGALCDILNMCPALVELNLDGNPLSKKSEQRFEDYLKAHREAQKEVKTEPPMREMKGKKEARKLTILGEWARTGLPPQDEQMASEFYEMWDEVLKEWKKLIFLLCTSTTLSKFNMKQISLVSSSASDDESFHLATDHEELDEPVEHHPSAGDQSTPLTIVSPHRMDQQETKGSTTKVASTEEIGGCSEDITMKDPYHNHSQTECTVVAALTQHTNPKHPVPKPRKGRPTKLNPTTQPEASSQQNQQDILEQSTGVGELMVILKVSDSQLDTEIKEADMILLAAHFDNVETYPVQLGLSPAEQQTVKMLSFQYDIQTAMDKALRLWREHNPGAATYRALVEIVLRVGKKDLALQICRQCHQNVSYSS